MKRLVNLALVWSLFVTQTFAQTSIDFSNPNFGSVSLVGNPLEAPSCERPKKLSTLLNKANAKYNGMLGPKQSSLSQIDSEITQAKQVVEQKKQQYQDAVSDPNLSTEQKNNFRDHFQTAMANLQTLESQKSTLQSDISSINSQKASEINNIKAFEQYDNIEAYLAMAVSKEDALSGGKGMEILAVADVGRRLSCQQDGDAMSNSYSIFKQASNAFSVDMTEDTQGYMSRVQGEMIHQCKNVSDAKEAQYQALERLLREKTNQLQTVTEKIATVQALADGYLPALEAARMELQGKTDRQREADRWVKEAEGKVAAAEKKVERAEQKVAEAEQELKEAEEELKKAKAEEKKAENKKKMAMIVAAAAAAIYMACMGSTGGTFCAGPAQKKIVAALAVMAAILFLTAKKSEVAQAEARVKEAEAALKQAKAELEQALAELEQAEGELEQALAEQELANKHTHLTCSVNGSSQLMESFSGTEAEDGDGELEEDKERADSLMVGFLGKHNSQQPENFPEPQNRITYLEYVTGLSSSGVSQLKKVQRQVENEINEIQGIMQQMNAVTVSDFDPGFDDDPNFCLSSDGTLDQSCECQGSGSCLASNGPPGQNGFSGFNSPVDPSAGGVAATIGQADNGNFKLARSLSDTVAAQAQFAAAKFSGNKAAAAKARKKLREEADNLSKLSLKFRGSSPVSPSGLKGFGGGLAGFDSDSGFGGSVSLESGAAGFKGAELNTSNPALDSGSFAAKSGLGIGGKVFKSSRSRSPASNKKGDIYGAPKVMKKTEIAVDTGDSIFKTITDRYQSTAYPILLRRKASGLE